MKILNFRWPAQDATDTGTGAGAVSTDDAAAKAATEAAALAAADAATAAAAAAATAAGKKPGDTGTTDTGKTPEQIAAETAAAEAARAAAQPPAEYKLKLPDGVHVDATDVKAVAELAKANKWTNDQAQAVLQAEADARAALAARFLTEAQAHAEVGGDKLALAQTRARAVMDRFLPPDSTEGKVLRTELLKTGYGNWLPLVLLFDRIGAAMGEDTVTGGRTTGGGAQKKSDAEVLFPGAAATP